MSANNLCCEAPKLYCNICKKGVCNKHRIDLLRLHTETRTLTPAGLPIFLCGDVAVSYITVEGVVVFESMLKVAEKIVNGKKEKA